MALTKKQRAFIEEYLQCWNATEAATRAGYSKKTAYSIGWENLRKPEIAEVVRKRLEEKAMTSDEVLKRLSDVARGDIADFLSVGSMTFDVSLKQAHELGLTHLIKKIKQNTKYTKDDEEIHHIEVELHDPLKALELLGKHYRLFTDRIEHSGEIKKVELTLDEWKDQQEKRAQEAEATLKEFGNG